MYPFGKTSEYFNTILTYFACLQFMSNTELIHLPWARPTQTVEACRSSIALIVKKNCIIV